MVKNISRFDEQQNDCQADNPPMHETMKRFYEAVERLTGIKGQSAVARAMNESPQVLKNWESRGISSNGLDKARKVFGIYSDWIKTGEGCPDQATQLLQNQMMKTGGFTFDDWAVVETYLASLDATPEIVRRVGNIAEITTSKRRKILPDAARAKEHDDDMPMFCRRAPETENTEPGPDMRGLVPLISWVTAGGFEPASDPLQPGDAEDWLPMPKKNGKHTYALRVRGDSMTSPHGKSYPDGCIIFVDPEKRSPNTGDRIIAKLEGTDEVTFKQFVSDAGRVWLKALNPTYPLLTDEFKVLGTIIGKWEDE